MKSKWIVPLLAATGVLVAMAAFAADAVKRTAPPDVRKEVVRIVEVDDDEGADEFEWEGADDFGMFALGDDGPGAGGDRRIVIRRGEGLGAGMGRGQGGDADEEGEDRTWRRRGHQCWCPPAPPGASGTVATSSRLPISPL